MRAKNAVLCLFLLGACVNAADAPAPDLFTLGKNAQAAYDKGNYDEAVTLLREAAKFNVQISLVKYRLACALAMGGHKENALEELAGSVAAGLREPDAIKQEKAFETLRDEAKFKDAVILAEQQKKKRDGELAKAPEPKEELIMPAAASAEKKVPLLVFMHGMGGSAAETRAVFEDWSGKNGCAVLLPCGSDRLGLIEDKPAYNWALKDSRLLEKRVKELIAEGKVNPERIYLSGFSAGGNMCYYVACEHPDLFVGIIPAGGAIQNELVKLEALKACANRISAYLIHGEQDPVMPHQLGIRAFWMLKAAGMRAHLESFKGGHHLPENYGEVFLTAMKWLDEQQRELKADAAQQNAK